MIYMAESCNENIINDNLPLQTKNNNERERICSEISLESIDVSKDKFEENEYYFQSNNDANSIIVIQHGIVKTVSGRELSCDSIETLRSGCIPISEEEATLLGKIFTRSKLYNTSMEIIRKLTSECEQKVSSNNQNKKINERITTIYTELKNSRSAISKVNVMKSIGEDKFIKYLNGILSNLKLKNVESEEFWKLWSLTLSIFCDILLDYPFFAKEIVEKTSLMILFKDLFDVLKQHESGNNTVLIVIKFHFQILKFGENIDKSLIDNFEHFFEKAAINKDIKLGAALCLSYLMDSPSKKLGHLYIYLDNISKRFENDYKHFSQQEIMMCLGKVSSIVDQDHVTFAKLENILDNINQPNKGSGYIQINDETYKNLTILYKSIECPNIVLMDLYTRYDFIEMLRRILGEFQAILKAKELHDSKHRVMLDCVMTSLKIICDLCNMEYPHTEFVTKMKNDFYFMFLLKDIMNNLMKYIKSLSAEEPFLKLIIHIYWNILRHASLEDDDVNIKFEDCFNNTNVNKQIKIASALCLTALKPLNSDIMERVTAFLLELLENDSSEETCEFSRNEILSGLGQIFRQNKTAEKTEVSVCGNELSSGEANEEETSAVKLRKRLEDVTADSGIITFSDNLYNGMKLIHKNIPKVDYTLVDFYSSEKFIDKIKKIFENSPLTLLTDNLSDPNHKVMLDCFMMTLRIISDLCDLEYKHSQFVAKITEHPTFMYLLEKIFINLQADKELLPTEEICLEIIICIYWRIMRHKSNKVTNKLNMEHCYNTRYENKQIKIGAALCLSALESTRPQLKADVAMFLSECLEDDSSREIIVFSRTEILCQLGNISCQIGAGHLRGSWYDIIVSKSSDLNETIINDSQRILDNIIVERDKFITMFDKHLIKNIFEYSLTQLDFLRRQKTSQGDKESEKTIVFIDKMLNLILNSQKDLQAVFTHSNFIFYIDEMFGNFTLETISDERLITKVLRLYWSFMKYGLQLRQGSHFKIKVFFQTKENDDELKFISALCLTHTKAVDVDTLNSVRSYLESQSGGDLSDKIHNCRRSDVILGLGFIMLQQKKIQSSVESNSIRKGINVSSTTEASMECFLMLLENITSIDCCNLIKRTLEMSHYPSATRLIQISNPPVDLMKEPNILKLCIQKDNKNILLELMKRCQIGPANYDDILNIILKEYKQTSQINADIVTHALRNIKKENVNCDMNQKLLAIAYEYSEASKYELFKILMEICPKPNDYLLFNDGRKATETFLTKMIKELPLSQIEIIWQYFKFDTNTPNNYNESPLVLAVLSRDNVQMLNWLIENKSNPFENEHHIKALAIAYDIPDTNNKNEVLEKLKHDN